MTSAQFRKIREKLQLTQGQLARKLGVTLNTVSRWELGTAPILKTTELALRYLCSKKNS